METGINEICVRQMMREIREEIQRTHPHVQPTEAALRYQAQRRLREPGLTWEFVVQRVLRNSG